MEDEVRALATLPVSSIWIERHADVRSSRTARQRRHMEKIVASAICRDGNIVIGNRHADCIKTAIQEKGWEPPVTQDEQGFVDATGKFLTREQARHVARITGQIPCDFVGVLLSEDLW